MKTDQIKAAKLISFIGHPLLTIPIYLAAVMFAFEDFTAAPFNSALIIGGIFLPWGVRMYIMSLSMFYTEGFLK